MVDCQPSPARSHPGQPVSQISAMKRSCYLSIIVSVNWRIGLVRCNKTPYVGYDLKSQGARNPLGHGLKGLFPINLDEAGHLRFQPVGPQGRVLQWPEASSGLNLPRPSRRSFSLPGELRRRGGASRSSIAGSGEARRDLGASPTACGYAFCLDTPAHFSHTRPPKGEFLSI
jgi:hypothetical protein